MSEPGAAQRAHKTASSGAAEVLGSPAATGRAAGAAAAARAAAAAAAPLAELFHQAGHRVHLVGGVVREAMSGVFSPDCDFDCATDARPEVTRRLVAAHASAVWTQGQRFGTIGCVIDGRSFEITTYRADRYRSDSRKPTVAFGDDLIEDLARRDFTVNAMALDIVNGGLTDPHDGRRDLQRRVLRTPLDPEISFGDDPLRMLRAARFIAGLGLAPVDGLVAAVRRMRGRLEIVAVERIRDETQRLLTLPDPTAGLEFLWDTGLASGALHLCAPADAAKASRAVKAVPSAPAARWAALLSAAPDSAASKLRRMRLPNAVVAEAAGLLRARSTILSAAGTASAVRRAVAECPVDVDEALSFTRAVSAAHGEPVGGLDAFASVLARLREQGQKLPVTAPLDGEEVMAALQVGPGVVVGRALAFLRELGFEKGPLEKAEAIAELRRWQASHYGGGA